jgi:hypothetical protein
MNKYSVIDIECMECREHTLSKNKTQCPLCGSNKIQTKEVKISPDGVIPFKTDKKHAKKIFHAHIKRHIFAPSAIRRADIEGIYIPFKLYNAIALSTYFGRGGRDFTVKNKDGHQHTSTDWSSVTGFIEESYHDIPVCEAKAEISKSAEKILPYDLKNITVFNEKILLKYPSVKPVLDDKEAFSEADAKMEKKLKNKAKINIQQRGFHYPSVEKIKSHYTDVKSREVFFPVFMTKVTYKGKEYIYMINGETGKITGKIPVSKEKTSVFVIVAAVIISMVAVLNNLENIL